MRCARQNSLDQWHPGATAVPEPAAVVHAGPLIEANALEKRYRSGGGFASGPRRDVLALDGVSLSIGEGETLALVGESGCGKSTFAKVLAGLETVDGGDLRIRGVNLGRRPVENRAADAVRALQMVFQNPDATLNPSHTVGFALARPLKRLRGLSASRRRDEIARLLALVRLPSDYASRKPGQLSGGEKQRVAIARAIAASPDLLIADEPVSALDVSVQAAIVNLLVELQDSRDMALLFISHDLAVVRYLADRVVVMYRGQVMEAGMTNAVFALPSHPYTEALLSAAPDLASDATGPTIRLAGSASDATATAAGCPLASRCPRKLGALCDEQAPPIQQVGRDHVIACHIPLDELANPAPIAVRINDA